MSNRKSYPSDLTDAQWVNIEPFVRVDEEKLGPQAIVHDRREIVNAILYRLRTGCQWRYLPHDLPDWQSAYHYFSTWNKNGTWARAHDALRAKVRIAAGKKPTPTAAILDSQSIRTTEEAEDRGYDGGKKIKGRKRHLLVDTLGLLLVSWVSVASVQDRDSVARILPIAKTNFPTLKKIWVDGGYRGPRVQAVAKKVEIDVEVVKRAPGPGFVLLAKRWIVERTNAWVQRDRALAKDYERKSSTSEALIQISMLRLMARRLA